MPGLIQSIERAAAVLRLIAGSSGRLGVGEIARSLDLPKGTAHGILRTLQEVGFVEQDHSTGKYRLRPALLHPRTSYPDANDPRPPPINWGGPLATPSGEGRRGGAP